MTHRGPFQPRTFCDSVIAHWSRLATLLQRNSFENPRWALRWLWAARVCAHRRPSVHLGSGRWPLVPSAWKTWRPICSHV